MQTPDQIEAALGRLIPPALSESARRGIEDRIDQLAGSQPLPAVRPRPHRGWWIGGLAATGLAALWVAPVAIGPALAPIPGATPGTAPGVVWISESGRVESLVADGWREEPDGSAMLAHRLNVIEENDLLDEETGLIIKVREPREEVLLTPVSSF
jgi:hypothetical protein